MMQPNLFNDGSVWWRVRRRDHVSSATYYWVKFADGRTCYTYPPFDHFGESTFDTLDNSSAYERVEDPRDP